MLLNLLKVVSDCNLVAANIIPTIRQPEYDDGLLVRGHGLRASVGSKEADKKFEKRKRIREAYQELSRYYILKKGRSEWTTTELVVRGRCGCDRSTPGRFIQLTPSQC